MTLCTFPACLSVLTINGACMPRVNNIGVDLDAIGGRQSLNPSLLWVLLHSTLHFNPCMRKRTNCRWLWGSGVSWWPRCLHRTHRSYWKQRYDQRGGFGGCPLTLYMEQTDLSTHGIATPDIGIAVFMFVRKGTLTLLSTRELVPRMLKSSTESLSQLTLVLSMQPASLKGHLDLIVWFVRHQIWEAREGGRSEVWSPNPLWHQNCRTFQRSHVGISMFFMYLHIPGLCLVERR